MKTRKEYNESKQELINQGRLIQELTNHQGYELLMKRLEQLIDEAKESIIKSQSHEELVERRAKWEGLLTLSREVETFVNKGLSAEKTIKK